MAEVPNTRSALFYGRVLIFILLLCIAGILVYKSYWGGSSTSGGSYTKVPKEYQINYMPADFRANIDPEDAVAILSNPRRYRKEFNELVYNLNTSILRHVGNRMGLTESQKEEVAEAYEEHHPYLRNLYFNDFLRLKDTTSVLYQSWYDNESTNAVEILDEIASRYTCFLVNLVMTNVVKTMGWRYFSLKVKKWIPPVEWPSLRLCAPC